MNSYESFNHWFVIPLQRLKSVPNNDGSFVALASALFLYERYIVAKIESLGGKVDETKKIEVIAGDFEVDLRAAEVFWDVMRNGILHQGMPKTHKHSQKVSDWIFHHDKSDVAFELHEINGKSLLIIQPWLVVDKIIYIWQDNLNLLEQNESFPWAQVSYAPNNSPQSESSFVTGSSSGLSILGMDGDIE